MPSISEIQSDADAALQSPRPQQSASGGVASDVPVESGDAVPEPQTLPDICNLEWQREGMPDTEFNRKYPPDPWGEEMGPNARVWKVYRDQQELLHNGMLESWNKTLDVLLIFAGLFSAVLTAFLIESYKALQPEQYVAVFLYAAAVSNNRTGGVFPALDNILAPDRFVQTSAAQRWTNGLWFSSLVISLAVALLCILIKQWLDAYNSHVLSEATSPQYWARRHCMYHRGLTNWGVPGLISFLPLLLHVSLFLFFGGLVLFLLPLDDTIAYSLLVMVSSILTFYALSLVLPAWRVECPSHTPLLAHAGLLAQKFLTISRGRECLLFLMELLERLPEAVPVRPCGFDLYRLVTSLRTMAFLGADRLRHKRPPSSQGLMQEAGSVSKTAPDLDGHIICSLINLPSDPSWEIVHITCGAVGAVTSSRTIQIITGRMPGYDFRNMLSTGYKRITSRGTGFWICAHAQFRRAGYALGAGTSAWDPLYTSGLYAPLGVEGLLLQAMGRQKGEGTDFDMNILFRSLQSLLVAADGSGRFPLRSTCLRFLGYYTKSFHVNSVYHSCLLLAFCAGRFSSADMQEFMQALRSVETVLLWKSSSLIPEHSRGDREYQCAVVNGIWSMLADPERYHVDALTAEILARHAYEWYTKINYSWSWDRLPGLSAFVRSPTFAQCVPTTASAGNYAYLVRCPCVTMCSDVQIGEYWLCVATILKMSWDRVPQFSQAYVSGIEDLFPVIRTGFRLLRRDRKQSDWLTRRGPTITRDDWYEFALTAFLVGPSAVATWTGANSPGRDPSSILELACLASGISLVLCRRKRLCRANDAFIRGFFTGTFVLARFQDLVSGEHIPRDEDRFHLKRCLLDLAKHCLKLSPDDFVAICTQLEETGDADSEIRARAVAFGQRLRDGSKPGGELSWECEAYWCPCMIYLHRQGRGWRNVWSDVVAGLRRRITEIVPAEHV